MHKIKHPAHQEIWCCSEFHLQFWKMVTSRWNIHPYPTATSAKPCKMRLVLHAESRSSILNTRGFMVPLLPPLFSGEIRGRRG